MWIKNLLFLIKFNYFKPNSYLTLDAFSNSNDFIFDLHYGIIKRHKMSFNLESTILTSHAIIEKIIRFFSKQFLHPMLLFKG